jgi:hypothetical protein
VCKNLKTSSGAKGLIMEGVTPGVASTQALAYESNKQIPRSQDRKCDEWRYAAAEQPS